MAVALTPKKSVMSAIAVPRLPRAPVIIEAPKRERTHFLIAIAAIIAVAALAVLSASVRVTDRVVARAVEEREAPKRFLAEEISVLRLFALTSSSVVPARLYLGIEECFHKAAPIPFDRDIARHNVGTCAEAELGKLHAHGGAELERRGRDVLAQAGISSLAPRATLQAGNFERR